MYLSLYRFHPTHSFSTALFGGRLYRILPKLVNICGKQGVTNLLVYLCELCLSGCRFYVTQVFWTAFFFMKDFRTDFRENPTDKRYSR